MQDDDELLNQLLEEGTHERARLETHGLTKSVAPSDAPPPSGQGRLDLDLCQWQVGSNGVFRPTAKTIPTLEPGAYSTGEDNYGPFLVTQPLMSDDIVRLPDSANERVLVSIKKFWTARYRYEAHGLLFKRGILLWGPPGSGKTITVHLLSKDLIGSGGIVLFCENPKLLLSLLSAVRRIERKRPLIIVMEDIDEVISHYGEHAILAMLDGEHQTDNVVFIATTNYPGRLGARIVNRPSRFDERIHVGMPTESVRLAYLLSVATGVGHDTVKKWAQDTEGLSIAHLRELIVAVACLDQDYDTVLNRLKKMTERPKEDEGFREKEVGFRKSNGQVTSRNIGPF